MIRAGIVSAPPTALTDRRTVHVKLEPIAGCGSCAASGGCGVQLLPTSEPALIIECKSRLGASLSIGQHVQVQVPEPGGGWLRVVGLAYGIPTVGMILGAVLGNWLALTLQLPQWRELLALAGFAAGLAGGLIAWHRSENTVRRRYSGDKSPEMATIVGLTLPEPNTTHKP